jgi:predicted acyltransferase
MMKILSPRVAAVDVFRALTMTLMLFVNDIPGLHDIPHWLRHAEIHEDMMGFSDLIFPAFLFCMGMSVSLAVQSRYRKGDTTLQVIAHLFWRSLALIVMGLFTLNNGGIEGGLSTQWFSVIMVAGIFLVWAVYPKATGGKRYLYLAMKAAGVCLLAFLVVYKDLHGQPFQTGWWGILGLIGWTYALCAGVYLFTRESLAKNVAVWLVCIALCVLNNTSLIPDDYALRVVRLSFIPGGWTHHALGMSGVVASLLLQKYATPYRWRTFCCILCSLGIVMFVAGLVSHPHWIISKNLATPTWLFFCLALFFPLFAFFYWLTDVRGKAGWFNLIKPAGTATLTCYIIPYLWYAVWQLLALHYPPLLYGGVPGLLRSLFFALLIVVIGGGLVKIGVRLKV